MTGAEARARIRATAATGSVVIGAGAGTGLSAKCAQAGGADLIIVYNSGRFRMAGRGSLAGMMPYGDANAIVREDGREGVTEASEMARAGADLVVAHMGLTTAGSVGAQTAKTLDECVAEVQAIRDAAAAIDPDVLVLCHGGPLAEPDDAAYVLERTHGVHGFFGASSIERLPAERAITDTVRRFKALSAGARPAPGPSRPALEPSRAAPPADPLDPADNR